MDSIYACHFKAAGWAVAVAAYTLRIRASDRMSPGLINLTLTIQDTPTYMMAVQLNDIHIYWIAIGSGSHLRRNMPSCNDTDYNNKNDHLKNVFQYDQLIIILLREQKAQGLHAQLDAMHMSGHCP